MFGHQSEPVTLTRDCKAVIIPAGEEARLHAGQLVFITQSLGGSFTVYVDGWLYRIAGLDADDPHDQRCGRRARLRTALEPEHDVRGRPTRSRPAVARAAPGA